MAMWIVGVCLAIPLIILFVLKLYISTGTKCKLDANLDGKVIIITGGNGGLGRATALEAVQRGAHVVMACRNKVKAEATVAYIRKKSKSDLVNYLPLDLVSMQSVKEFVGMFLKHYPFAYAIINNAAYMGPKKKTLDGYDMCYQTNYMAHFYLTQLLILRSKPDKEHPLRVINITSDSYRTGQLDMNDLMCNKGSYDIYKTYGSTKLALVLLTTEMNYRHHDDGISSVAVQPGAVYTRLLRNWPGIKGDILRLAAKFLFRSPKIGAQAVIYSLLVDSLDEFNGKIIYDCAGLHIESKGRDFKQAEKLWNITWDMCNLGAEAAQLSSTQ